MPNACIALFFEKTVYLIQEKDGSWNFPGGKLKPREDALEGAFREFQEEIGNKLFNLENWARDTGNIFTPYNVYHSNGVGPPHTTIFYCICKSKPVFTFRKNKETIDGNWFDVYNLPQPLRYSSISELTQKVSNPVRSIHHMGRDVEPGFIGFTGASALSASAPPFSDDDDNDDDDVKEAIRLSLQDMPPPPSYDDIGQYSVLPFQKKRGGTIKNKNKGGKGRKKNKMRKNIKSLKKYKKNKKNI